MAVAVLLGAANCVTLKREPLITWAPTEPTKDHPINYFVPHFGTDSDIKGVA